MFVNAGRSSRFVKPVQLLPMVASLHGLPALLFWFKEHGIVWNEDLLEIRGGLPATGGGGLGVYARKLISDGDLLCEIPKASILSVKTTSIADILEDSKIAGGLGLTIALMHEHTLGRKSQWYSCTVQTLIVRTFRTLRINFTVYCYPTPPKAVRPEHSCCHQGSEGVVHVSPHVCLTVMSTVSFEPGCDWRSQGSEGAVYPPCVPCRNVNGVFLIGLHLNFCALIPFVAAFPCLCTSSPDVHVPPPPLSMCGPQCAPPGTFAAH